jgi:hypothetical protein
MARAAVISLTVLLTALLVAAPAQGVPAGTPSQGPAPLAMETVAGGPHGHCVVTLPAGTQRCFDSFTDAIAFATGGAITDAPADAAKAATPAFARRIDAVGATGCPCLLGLVWVHADFAGASKGWTANSTCDTSGDVDHGVGYVGNSWNDVISSSRGYNNCQLKHWEHANWEGRSTGWLSSASYLGDAMNDETSSLQFA